MLAFLLKKSAIFNIALNPYLFFFKLSSHLEERQGQVNKCLRKTGGCSGILHTICPAQLAKKTSEGCGGAVERQADEGAKRSGKSYYIFIYTLIYFLHFDL